MHRLFLTTLIFGSLLATSAAARDGAQVKLGPNADLGGRRLLPDDSPWHKDISKDPVDPNSARILARIGLDKPLASPISARNGRAPPWASSTSSSRKNQKKVPVTFTDADESDAGPYPIPPDAPIEGGPKGDGDRHILVLDRDSWKLWELFNAFPDGKGGWKADSGAIWDSEEEPGSPRPLDVRRRRRPADPAGPRPLRRGGREEGDRARAAFHVCEVAPGLRAARQPLGEQASR